MKGERMTKVQDHGAVSRPVKKRHRGGQPQNRNAHKHGFYSKYFNTFENKALADVPHSDLTDVIDLMRISTGRFLEAYSASLEELDFYDKHAAFRSLGLAAGVIASLVRIQNSTGRNARETNEIIEQLKKIEFDLEIAEQKPG
jgi:hypothetical protein